MLKRISALVFALLGFVLAAIELFNNQAIMALALALTGIYVAFAVIAGMYESLMSPAFQAAAIFIGAISMYGVLTYHRAFDINLQNAHAEAITQIARLEMTCRQMPAELRDIQKFGVAACALQGNSDQLSATVELVKGQYLGPTLSLADAALTLSNADTPNFCARAYRAAFQHCPDISLTVSKRSHEALLAAAD